MTLPANNGVAPICNAKAEQPDFFTKPPTIPKFAPPDFTNPQSVAQAILALQNALIALTAQPPPNNMVPGFGAGAGPAGGSPFGGNGSPKQTPTNNDWQETQRQTQNVKVVNPDDDTQFVIVKEITFITFTHASTGETLTFTRDPQ